MSSLATLTPIGHRRRSFTRRPHPARRVSSNRAQAKPSTVKGETARAQGALAPEHVRVGAAPDRDRLLSYGPFDFTYTANGELETKTNRDTGDVWLFQYDALGNLLTVALPNGDLIEYLVDGRGRRVGKKKNGVLLKQWIYRDALKPAAELDGSGALVSEFVYGSKSNVPDYVRRGGATYRVISDHLGSPRYVVNVASASDVPLTATYTSFGEATGSGLDWMPFGFAGGLYDPDTKVIRFGKRDFDPTIGRWIAKEPLRFKAGRNFYAYAWNNPIDLFDPTGLDPMGAGGASGEGGSQGAGNDPIESSDPGIPQYSDWDACFDRCMESQGANVVAKAALMCVPFLPVPKTEEELAKTLVGGSGRTTLMSRAASAMGLPATNALRSVGRVASTVAVGGAVGGAAYYGTSAALCGAQCSQ